MRKLAIVVVALIASVVSAQAEVVVLSSSTAKLGTFGSVDQGCHSLGGATINVLQQPHAGAILVSSVLDYPNFPTINYRSRCNTMRLRMTRVSYRSSAGYIGPDEAVIEVIFPEGAVKRLRFVMSVRASNVPVLPLDPSDGAAVHARHRHATAVSRAHQKRSTAPVIAPPPNRRPHAPGRELPIAI